MNIRIAACALFLGVAPVGAGADFASAQEAMTACSTQAALEQVIGSNGTITPDECQSISVNSLASDGRQLCLINFGAGESGLLDQVRDFAMPSEWWVECELLAAAVAPR